jgi:hypothetical protein
MRSGSVLVVREAEQAEGGATSRRDEDRRKRQDPTCSVL